MIIVNKTLFSHIFVKKKYLEAQMKAKLHVVIQYKFWFVIDSRYSTQILVLLLLSLQNKIPEIHLTQNALKNVEKNVKH